MQYDLEEISKFFQKSYLQVKYDNILCKSYAYKVTNRELKNLEEQFYTDQVNIKLAVIENSHVFTEEELSAIRRAKIEFENFDGITKSDITVFQKKIQKLEKEEENFSKHYLMASMEMLKFKKEMESLIERRNLYKKMQNDMKSKYKKSRFSNFVKKFKLRKSKSIENLSEKTADTSDNLSKEDIIMCEHKLRIFDQELEDLQKQYNEKLQIYNEALVRAQEINDKKQIYSNQLCGFLHLIK